MHISQRVEECARILRPMCWLLHSDRHLAYAMGEVDAGLRCSQECISEAVGVFAMWCCQQKLQQQPTSWLLNQGTDGKLESRQEPLAGMLGTPVQLSSSYSSAIY